MYNIESKHKSAVITLPSSSGSDSLELHLKIDVHKISCFAAHFFSYLEMRVAYFSGFIFRATTREQRLVHSSVSFSRFKTRVARKAWGRLEGGKKMGRANG